MNGRIVRAAMTMTAAVPAVIVTGRIVCALPSRETTLVVRHRMPTPTPSCWVIAEPVGSSVELQALVPSTSEETTARVIENRDMIELQRLGMFPTSMPPQKQASDPSRRSNFLGYNSHQVIRLPEPH